MASSNATRINIGKEQFSKALQTMDCCDGDRPLPAILNQLLSIRNASSSGNLGTSTKFSSGNNDYNKEKISSYNRI